MWVEMFIIQTQNGMRGACDGVCLSLSLLVLLGLDLGELLEGLGLGGGVGVLGRLGQRVALRLEAVLVGHPVDAHLDVVALLVLGGEGVGALLHGARFLSDLLQLASHVLRRRIGRLVAVLEAAVLVGDGRAPEESVLLGRLELLRPAGGHGQQSGEHQLQTDGDKRTYTVRRVRKTTGADWVSEG